MNTQGQCGEEEGSEGQCLSVSRLAPGPSWPVSAGSLPPRFPWKRALGSPSHGSDLIYSSQPPMKRAGTVYHYFAGKPEFREVKWCIPGCLDWHPDFLAPRIIFFLQGTCCAHSVSLASSVSCPWVQYLSRAESWQGRVERFCVSLRPSPLFPSFSLFPFPFLFFLYFFLFIPSFSFFFFFSAFVVVCSPLTFYSLMGLLGE